MKSFVCIVLHHFFYTKICLFILGAQIKEPQRFETLTFQPPPNQQQTNRTDIKSKMDEQLKSQHQAVGRSVLSHSPTTNSLTQVIKKGLFTFLGTFCLLFYLFQQQPMTPPTIIRRIQNPDGSVSILRTTMNTRPQMVQQSPQQQQQQVSVLLLHSCAISRNFCLIFTLYFTGNSTWYEKGFHFQRWQNNRCTACSTAQSCCKPKHYQNIPSVRGWRGAKPSGHAYYSSGFSATNPSDAKSATKSANCPLS